MTTVVQNSQGKDNQETGRDCLPPRTARHTARSVVAGRVGGSDRSGSTKLAEVLALPAGFVTALVLPRGNAADSPHFVTMVKEQITNTGVIPSMASADDGYSTQQGREEVIDLGLKVVSISGAKGKKLIRTQQWKSKPYRQARAERSAMESLVFTLKESFEFGELVRRTHENVLAEMLEKALAYNISQIMRVRKKLSEPEETQRAAA